MLWVSRSNWRRYSGFLLWVEKSSMTQPWRQKLKSHFRLICHLYLTQTDMLSMLHSSKFKIKCPGRLGGSAT